MTPAIRLLPFASADGPTHMAADDALLQSAADGGPASLRFYTWAEPTLSLGYFQPAADRAAPNLSALPWVRRATGGAAIVHHHELTYALALPPGRPWQPPGEAWVCRFHHVIQGVLSAAGVRSRGVVCGEAVKLGDVLCFLHQTPADVLVNGSKVVGSAQRKQRGALLQHGSILLRRSPFAPELPGVYDAAGKDLFPSLQAFAAELTTAFAADTGWRVEPGDWTDSEHVCTSRVQAETFASAAWNEKR